MPEDKLSLRKSGARNTTCVPAAADMISIILHKSLERTMPVTADWVFDGNQLLPILTFSSANRDLHCGRRRLWKVVS